LKTNELIIRPITVNEIGKVSKLLATAYEGDIFFEWCVPSDEDRHEVVSDYYKVYLRAKECVAHLAEDDSGEIVGASVWLPHDTDPSIYKEIDKVTGVNAPMFNEVADKSHMSEPPMGPFYQLVGFGVLPHLQGYGIGKMLLEYHLNILDKIGIPTYLEASTPYYGDGVYSKFDYQPVGELMVFSENIVLYPLWRPAKVNANDGEVVTFGRYKWQVLDCNGKDMLLLSKDVLQLKEYNKTFENTTWATSTVRKYLNDEFINSFTPEEQRRIYETSVQSSGNMWYETDGGSTTFDKVFLLSIGEVEKYLGGNKVLNTKGESSRFYIDDKYNKNRQGKYKDGSPSRWFLRTPGKSSDFVATVTIDGRVSVTGDFVNRPSTLLFKVGVRPAMWVSRGEL
jgi:ribosomal protein S18 acetylase RimI-like enzyme